MTSLLGSAGAMASRDFALLWRRRGDAMQPVWFSVLVVVLFAIAMNAEAALLARISAGVIWVCILLANLLSLDPLFRNDLEDGVIEQWMLSPVPLGWLMGVRVLMHWLLTTGPLLIVTPALALLMKFPVEKIGWLVLALALGSLLQALIGAVIAALTIGIRRSGMLMALLTLPMFVPILIFGMASLNAALSGLDPWGAGLLQLLTGVVVALVIAPWATATALRIAMT